ncbi:MAG: amidase family protein [Alphaproteobacteria bacterium]|jgi:amidase|nr:amidase [Rhodospirillaceae bacterium]MDG2481798.1 amidase family protein [Alphaproteobacteria bacterium]MBT6203346.1 amidase [Rhodospirillaceae bacterium]MBT6512580.1 amidase [Rhodospirillaceae bacterium]MBT7612759.1 amidase [Rhodospirillaceae bacterium]
MTELWSLTARRAIELLKAGEVSPLEMVDACADRIDATDGGLNAMPTRCYERARGHAKRLMDKTASNYDGPGALHGLPLAVKELEDVAGVRTTYGSPIFANHVPEKSDIMVERLEQRGAIVMGKSNVPEFGAGGNSFNEVLGVSRNPWNQQRSPGGSSGGSAAALAAGQVPIATGSDLGGSLRIPASFCGIVGFRPSPGVVAKGPDAACFNDMSVAGPMARNVPDTALMLDAMAGTDYRDPLSRPKPVVPYLDDVMTVLGDGSVPRRIGYSPDLGVGPVDAEVDAICRAATERFAELGTEVTSADLDLSDGPEAFHTFRGIGFAAGHEDHLELPPGQLKPENIWNIKKGLKLKSDDVLRAHRARGALYQRVATFFADHDLLAVPSTIVPAIPTEMRYLKELNGHRFGNYVDWIILTSVITLTACPAISIPCGFTKAGLPVGLQLVGASHSDGQVLAWAAVAERLFGLADQLPIDPRGEPGGYPDPEPEPHGD